mmetsp:Transcript_28389/g.98042  ORF Transcript_28389/g.98042 Transcript_28389/m.98042 type:complete len:210 (-) Transcript_28389:547-1176(-)
MRRAERPGMGGRWAWRRHRHCRPRRATWPRRSPRHRKHPPVPCPPAPRERPRQQLGVLEPGADLMQPPGSASTARPACASTRSSMRSRCRGQPAASACACASEPCARPPPPTQPQGGWCYDRDPFQTARLLAIGCGRGHRRGLPLRPLRQVRRSGSAAVSLTRQLASRRSDAVCAAGGCRPRDRARAQRGQAAADPRRSTAPRASCWTR